jgi:putative DNA primase/helicase
VKAHGVRIGPGGALLVPMHDAAGELWNVQTIRPERPADGGPEKLFIKGGRKTGTFHLIGNPEGAAVLLVAEGYATAASCHEATGRPAVVAFDAGNLPHVVRALRGRYPGALVMVCGDDDAATMARTGKNAGRDKATEAAKLARGAAVFPQGLADGASDWNDLQQSAGLDAVRAQIEAAIQAAQATQPTRGAPTPPDPEKAAPAGRQRAARGRAEEPGDGAAAIDRFRNEDGALRFDAPGEDGGPGRPVRVCGELHVTALARDAHDGGAALLLEFDTPFRAGRLWLMPLQMLAGDGTAYRAELLSQGFMVPTDAKRRALLTAYLQSRQPAALVRIVDRVGWQGRCYVLTRETLGDDGGERILFQSEAPTEGTFGQRGTLAKWREQIGLLCVGNSRLTFAVSMGFAGPLLAWASGTDGGGIHIVGDSSCGKTTALKVAASVWGGRDYLQRWRATDNGIESMAAQHSDSLLCLDELAQLDPRVAGESAYMLANGQGKQRAGRTGAARPRLTWRLLFLSAGEIGLAEHMREGNRSARAGQELRMVDLPADAGAGRGIFEELHGHEGGGALAQHLTRATEAIYGTAGRAWLEHLVDNTEGLGRRLRERMDVIEAQLVPELASGQVQRVGRRFALVAAAGEMATEAGITGWPAGEAINGARRCFNAWIEARPGGIGMSETAQMLRQLRGWFGLHGDARFVDWHRADDDRAPKVMNRAGWRKQVKTTTGLDELTGWEWFILPDVFRAEVCKGFSDRAALRLLHDLGHLHRESPKGFGCRASPPGAEKVNVYRIKSSILSEADE